jgi:hypothetical protein
LIAFRCPPAAVWQIHCGRPATSNIFLSGAPQLGFIQPMHIPPANPQPSKNLHGDRKPPEIILIYPPTMVRFVRPNNVRTNGRSEGASSQKPGEKSRSRKLRMEKKKSGNSKDAQAGVNVRKCLLRWLLYAANRPKTATRKMKIDLGASKTKNDREDFPRLARSGQFRPIPVEYGRSATAAGGAEQRIIPGRRNVSIF